MATSLTQRERIQLNPLLSQEWRCPPPLPELLDDLLGSYVWKGSPSAMRNLHFFLFLQSICFAIEDNICGGFSAKVLTKDSSECPVREATAKNMTGLRPWTWRINCIWAYLESASYTRVKNCRRHPELRCLNWNWTLCENWSDFHFCPLKSRSSSLAQDELTLP